MRYLALLIPAIRHLENKASIPIGCTTVMCASCLTSASVHCSAAHVDAMLSGEGVLPFSQIGHKCYYRREDVELLLQSKSEKSKTDRIKNNK